MYGGEEDTTRKITLHINDIFDGVEALSIAYLCKLTEESITTDLKDSLVQACEVKCAATVLGKYTPPCVSQGSDRSFANIASRNKPSASCRVPTNFVNLNRAKSFPLAKCERVVIGP